MVEVFVFAVAALVCLGGAVGVIVSRNPVRAALSLVATLFGIAVLFVAQEAHFLAAVQVIVYAGAIVVLFLFVIMFLGVDEAENLRAEPLGGGQRIAAGVLGVGVVALVLAALSSVGFTATGVPGALGSLAPEGGAPDVNILGEALLTDYVFAFEMTSVLLTIAVVGAVVMSRQRVSRADEIVDAGQAEREAAIGSRIRQAEAGRDGPGGAPDGDGGEDPAGPDAPEGSDDDEADAMSSGATP